MQSQTPTVSVCVVRIPFTSLLGFLLWSLSRSRPQRAFSSSYLSIWSFSTQLIPAPSLFSSFLSKPLFLFWLQWLSPPAQRDIVLSDRAQIFNKRWVTVSDTLSKLAGGKGWDYRQWSLACETEPQPLSTVPLPVNSCHSAGVGVRRLESLCWLSLLQRDFLLTYIISLKDMLLIWTI